MTEREKRQKVEEGVWAEKLAKMREQKTRSYFSIMFSAHLAASQMSHLRVNQLPHRPEDDDFYHMKAEKENTKRKGIHTN